MPNMTKGSKGQVLFNKMHVYTRQALYTENFGYNMSGQAILLAFEAILGHRSAHSLATGPVMALPVKEMY